eukprot:GDKI01006473.1.p1 GENE.GDKI01006473.1~~GDKI01006473.1.p1  ORF type:complete len:988 (-),score=254.93 GDKI01006473.1:48-2936(-)
MGRYSCLFPLFLIAFSFQQTDAIKCLLSLPGGIIIATDFAYDLNINRCVKYDFACTATSTERLCFNVDGVAEVKTITIYGAMKGSECTKMGFTTEKCKAGDYGAGAFLAGTAGFTGTAGTLDCAWGFGIEKSPVADTAPDSVLDTCVRFKQPCAAGVMGCTAAEQTTNAPRWVYGVASAADSTAMLNYPEYFMSLTKCNTVPATGVCNDREATRMRCYQGFTESDDAENTFGPTSTLFNVCQLGTQCDFAEACRKYQKKCTAESTTLDDGSTVKVCSADEVASGIYKWVYDAASWEGCAFYQVNAGKSVTVSGVTTDLTNIRNVKCCTDALCNTPEYPKLLNCWNGQVYKAFNTVTYNAQNPLRDWTQAYDSCVSLQYTCGVGTTFETDGCTPEQNVLKSNGYTYGAVNGDQCGYLKTLTDVYTSVSCCNTDRCNGPTDYPSVVCYNSTASVIYRNDKLFSQSDVRTQCIKYQIECGTPPDGVPGADACDGKASGTLVWGYSAATEATCDALGVDVDGNPKIAGITNAECCKGNDVYACNAPVDYPPLTCYTQGEGMKKFENKQLNNVKNKVSTCMKAKIVCGVDSQTDSYGECTSAEKGVRAQKWIHGALQEQDKGVCDVLSGKVGTGVVSGSYLCCTTDGCNGPSDFPPLTCFNGTTNVYYSNQQLYAEIDRVRYCMKANIVCGVQTTDGQILTAQAKCTTDEIAASKEKWIYGVVRVGENTCEALRTDEKTGEVVDASTLCCTQDGCNSKEPLVCQEGFGSSFREIKVDTNDPTKDRCYRYRLKCTMDDPRCNSTEQAGGALLYKAGGTSLDMCNKLAAQPLSYNNLLCCQSNSCNARQNFKITCLEGVDNPVQKDFSDNFVCFKYTHECTSTSDSICRQSPYFYRYGSSKVVVYGATTQENCLNLIVNGGPNSGVNCCQADMCNEVKDCVAANSVRVGVQKYVVWGVLGVMFLFLFGK